MSLLNTGLKKYECYNKNLSYLGNAPHKQNVAANENIITPDKKNAFTVGNLEKGSEGKDYEKPVSHHADFGNALKRVMKEKLDNTRDYDSIKSYIEEYELIKQQTEKLLNKIEI